MTCFKGYSPIPSRQLYASITSIPSSLFTHCKLKSLCSVIYLIPVAYLLDPLSSLSLILDPFPWETVLEWFEINNSISNTFPLISFVYEAIKTVIRLQCYLTFQICLQWMNLCFSKCKLIIPSSFLPCSTCGFSLYPSFHTEK